MDDILGEESDNESEGRGKDKPGNEEDEEQQHQQPGSTEIRCGGSGPQTLGLDERIADPSGENNILDSVPRWEQVHCCYWNNRSLHHILNHLVAPSSIYSWLLLIWDDLELNRSTNIWMKHVVYVCSSFLSSGDDHNTHSISASVQKPDCLVCCHGERIQTESTREHMRAKLLEYSQRIMLFFGEASISVIQGLKKDYIKN